MAFVGLGNEYIKAGYTQVDNVFLLSYLPDADPLDVKIYLLGLAAATDADSGNTVENMAMTLKLSCERIMDGFRYWEQKGLVSISKTNPVRVKYLSVKNPLKPVVRINTEKYKVFVEEVERLFSDKILSPNEFNAYFELMHEYKMEINAMLLVMQYCKDLGKFSTPYVLAVASDWLKQGLNTEKKVSARIADLENNSEDVRTIFRTLGVRREAYLEDRQLYLKWKAKYNFDLSAILVAARSLKRRGGTEKLDSVMEELRAIGAVTSEEVARYLENKEKLKKLAVTINKNLGVYYSGSESCVEVYIRPWLDLGFEEEALVALSKFCFLRNYHTLDSMNQIIDKLHASGIIETSAVGGFIENSLSTDKKLKKLYERLNRFDTITNRDRENYRIWNEWGYSDEVIRLVAEFRSEQAFPIQAVNRTLANLRGRGIFSVDEVKKALEEEKTPRSRRKDAEERDDMMKHNYTEEQLKGVAIDFDDWKN